MDIQTTQSLSIPVLMLHHKGPYETISSKFDQLWGWINSNNIPVKRCIGIYWDNPDVVPTNELRSAACFEIADGYTPPALPDGIEVGSIAGGEYAVTRVVGPYENLEWAWSAFTSQVEEKLGRTISQNPAFECYVNDPSDTPADQLITDLYMPLE